METGWYNVTLGEFAEIRGILKDEGRSPEDRQIALAALLQGVTEDELLNMPLESARGAFELAASLNEKPKRARVRKVYFVDGWELRVTETKDTSVAQWVDFQTYARDMENKLVDVLSVVLVPKGKRYNEDYDIDKLKDALRRDMRVPDALAVCFFFQKRWLRSMMRSLNYLVGLMTVRGERELRTRALRTRAEVSAMLRSL